MMKHNQNKWKCLNKTSIFTRGEPDKKLITLDKPKQVLISDDWVKD